MERNLLLAGIGGSVGAPWPWSSLGDGEGMAVVPKLPVEEVLQRDRSFWLG